MKVPKLTPRQWFELVLALGPLLRGLVRVAGIGVADLIRALIDMVAQVEAMLPNDPTDIDPATKAPRKRGSERLAAFRDLVVAAFATADESAEEVEGKLGDLSAIAGVIVGLMKKWTRPEVVK